MSVMYRYIDADKMIAKIKPVQAEDETSCVLLGDVRRILKDFVNQAPIADVVEVVRCKDCTGAIKHKEYPDMYKCNGCNPVRGRLVSGKFGCICGEKKGAKE